jgi:hypothetical protein
LNRALQLRTVALGLGLAILVAGYFAMKRSHVSACYAPEIDLKSPDGMRAARLFEDGCSGPAYWVTVRNKDSWIGGETEVFVTWEFEPELAWRDDRHLVITIREVSHFGKTLHQGDGVTVVYCVADRLREQDFRRRLEDYEHRTEQLIREHRSTFTGDNAKDPQALKEVIAHEWADYRRFQEWAKANAENGGL